MVKSTIKLNLYMHPTEFAGEPYYCQCLKGYKGPKAICFNG